MTPEQWLGMATCFDIGICPIYNRRIIIESRDQMDGRRLWVVKMERSNGWVLRKDGEWEWEPLPSSRTDEFINQTRFDTPDQAYEFWRENVTYKKPLFVS